MLMRMGTRRHGRTRGLLLVVGTSEDLAAVERELATAPVGSYGQILIEADAETDVRALAAPPRMTVTWLLRRGEPGAALNEAVAAWAAEWMPETRAHDTPAEVRIGATAALRGAFASLRNATEAAIVD